ncbi:hypothetical protein [Paenibacillus dendritiformis]|uniref:Uncharacterized protein n=1 Tax=Paenibacillus dendritiformis C454 TaxID=1131935 RepID=H3SPT1_9BACL|nr:hypothetical protein [Paenibacillus dendritiformis]EHQ58910.1 hypothetical protein PDENDC454_27960 [Paenibacillus dendritiformis C454]CAH8771180.1 hypothetical protein H7S4_003915 [Paenibacillus dendritiformis]
MKKRALKSLSAGTGYSTAVFFDAAQSREKCVQNWIEAAIPAALRS